MQKQLCYIFISGKWNTRDGKRQTSSEGVFNNLFSHNLPALISWLFADEVSYCVDSCVQAVDKKRGSSLVKFHEHDFVILFSWICFSLKPGLVSRKHIQYNVSFLMWGSETWASDSQSYTILGFCEFYTTSDTLLLRRSPSGVHHFPPANGRGCGAINLDLCGLVGPETDIESQLISRLMIQAKKFLDCFIFSPRHRSGLMWHPLSLRAKPDIFTKVSMKQTPDLLGEASEMNVRHPSSIHREGAEKWAPQIKYKC